MMREFKVNDYIKLKLENKKTILYVAGERYRQCTNLKLKVPIDKISTFKEIKSIDELTEKYDLSKYRYSKDYKYTLTPEEEFWGYCSNLQVWNEHDYDTRLLHRFYAFPLLKKLYELGDPKAKSVFKKEIIKRFQEGHKLTSVYLAEYGYLRLFTLEELDKLFHEYINNDKIKKDIVVIGQFSFYNVEPAREELKKSLENVLVNESFRPIYCTHIQNWFKQLTRQELENLFNIYQNQVKIPKNNTILRLFKNLGFTEAVHSLKSLIINRFSNGKETEDDYYRLAEISNNFTVEELKKIILNVDYSKYDFYSHYLFHSKLKEFVKSGDKNAEKVLVDAVIKRFILGNQKERFFLIGNKFVNFIPIEKRKEILNEHNFSILTSLSSTRILEYGINYTKGTIKNNEDFLTEEFNKAMKGNLEAIIPKLLKSDSLIVSNEFRFVHKKYRKENHWYNFDYYKSSIYEGTHPSILLQDGKIIGFDLENCNYDTFPTELLNFADTLKTLKLGWNRFKFFPRELVTFKSIEWLSLGRNYLTTVHKSIENIKTLKILDLSVNHLRSLPIEITSLPKLEYIDLTGNSFKALPPYITKLKPLKWLYLSNNPIVKRRDLRTDQIILKLKNNGVKIIM